MKKHFKINYLVEFELCGDIFVLTIFNTFSLFKIGDKYFFKLYKSIKMEL